MSIVNLGIIGMSEGNGHPYSWSAILNGYDPHAMKNCPFPTIPNYLQENSHPEKTHPHARVTHIWCQSNTLSRDIAASAKIPQVVDELHEMLGEVDGVLLARDDAENHYQHAELFLRAGIPIYIDKLIAYDKINAEALYQLQQYDGQIFTGSALSYSPDLMVANLQQEIGDLIYIDACVMNSFKKYGIHIIEPVLALLPPDEKVTSMQKVANQLIVSFSSGLKASFVALDSPHAPITIRLFGTKGYKLLSHQNTYQAFNNALTQFINIIKRETQPQAKTLPLQIVNMIEEMMREQ